MEPQNYIVIQRDFYGGSLVRQRSGMYARLNDDGTTTGNYATIRQLMTAMSKETTNGSQDTANRETEGSRVQEAGEGVANDSSTSQKATVPAQTEAKAPARRKPAKK